MRYIDTVHHGLLRAHNHVPNVHVMYVLHAANETAGTYVCIARMWDVMVNPAGLAHSCAFPWLRM